MLYEVITYVFQENFSNCPLIGRVEKKYNMDYCPTFEHLFEKAKAAKLILPLDNDYIYSLLFSPISNLVKRNKITGNEISMNDLIQIFESVITSYSIHYTKLYDNKTIYGIRRESAFPCLELSR